MPLRVLYLDMNSFFASVEQQLQPQLRGRPVVVAAVNVDSTCCIAASVEAKQLGVRTGTPVWEARKHKGLRVITARPSEYVKAHHRIIAAVNTCVPVHAKHSIDEISCRLGRNQNDLAQSLELAHRIKQAIREMVGSHLRCSIGLAPNRLLAKLGSDSQKPDGLVVITEADLPEKLYEFELDELCGIGPRMLKRLNAAGVANMPQLYRLSEAQMRKIWGGVVGQRWWHWLRGYDLPESAERKSSVGHSHVLPPELRTEQGARAVLIRLIHKVGSKLRQIKYWAGKMEIYISYTYREEGWSGSVALGQCQDTQTMIEAFNDLWQHRPRGDRPTQVAVTLYELIPEGSSAIPLFAGQRRRTDLARAMDQINTKVGFDKVYFAGMHGMSGAAPTRIAFSQIPELRDDLSEPSSRPLRGSGREELKERRDWEIIPRQESH